MEGPVQRPELNGRKMPQRKQAFPGQTVSDKSIQFEILLVVETCRVHQEPGSSGAIR
jgi:hypothetical protein